MRNTQERNVQKTERIATTQKEREFKYTTRDRSMPFKQPTPNSSIEKPLAPKSLVKRPAPPVSKPSEADKVVKAVLMAKKHIVEEVSANFEEKLEKLDDAIAELISCKVENERLKNKIDNLTRENYKLKKEVKSYKSVVPGLFIKSKNNGIDL